MPDRAALTPDKVDGVGEKDGGIDAAPLRIAGREVTANIPGADRAEQRIGQSMQPDIRVGVAREAAIVGQRDAAEHYMVAFLEGMNIEAGRRTDICGTKQSLAVSKVFC